MRDFNLKEFLEGKPAVTRGGQKAFANSVSIRAKEMTLNVDGYQPRTTVNFSGRVGGTFEHQYDLVGMYEEPLKFKHWGMLSDNIYAVEKRSGGQWALWRADTFGAALISESDMQGDFFPECSIGTIIKRPGG